MLYTIQMASTASKMVFVQSELDEERRQQRREHGKHGKRGKHGKHGKHGRHAQDRSHSPSSSSDSEESDGKATHHHRHDKHGHRGHHGHHHHHHRCHTPTIKGPFTDKKLEVATLLYLATLGGANLCCLQDRIGSFAVGKAFDALHVSLDDASKNPAVWGEGVDESEKERNEKNLRRWLERFLFGGDNRNVRRVFVQGVVIGGVDVTQSQE